MQVLEDLDCQQNFHTMQVAEVLLIIYPVVNKKGSFEERTYVLKQTFKKSAKHCSFL